MKDNNGKELTREEFMEWFGNKFKRRAQFLRWLARFVVNAFQLWVMLVIITIFYAITKWVIGVWL